MSHPYPLQVSANLFGHIEDTASGICCLGMVLQALDVERLDDPQTVINGIGRLIERVGDGLLETSSDGKREALEALKQATE
jgi:hypothetical protein